MKRIIEKNFFPDEILANLNSLGDRRRLNFIVSFLTDHDEQDMGEKIQLLHNLLIIAEPDKKEAIDAIIHFLRVESIREEGVKRSNHFLDLKHGVIVKKSEIEYVIVQSGGCTIAIPTSNFVEGIFDLYSDAASILFVTTNSNDFEIIKNCKIYSHAISPFVVMDFSDIFRQNWRTWSDFITYASDVIPSSEITRSCDGEKCIIFAKYIGKAVLIKKKK